MKRKDLERVVGDTTHAATDLGKEALVQAQLYLQQAQEYLAPRAEDARKKGAKLAANALDNIQPKLDDALDKVSPAVENAYARLVPVLDDARTKVQKDLLPKLSDLLHEAADDVKAIELPEVPTPKKKKCSGLKTLGKFLLAGALLAGVAVALKKFFAPADSGWQAHEPSSPYVPTSPQRLVDDLTDKAEETADAASDYLDDAKEAVADAATQAKDAAAEAAETAGEAVADAVEAAGDAAEEVAEKAADAAEDAAEGDAHPFVHSPYGEGSYAGAEPPEGFVIKGNERSMKYHVKGNGGYERTNPDVWFSSEEAAQAAGFTKAQR